MLYFCALWQYCRILTKYNMMRNYDRQDEAQRHAQRDALISMVFRVIVHDLNKSCDYAYILIGRIWGLGERQIQKILKRSDESALGADDFAEFVVILHRISN
jgi:hypothetical protein